MGQRSARGALLAAAAVALAGCVAGAGSADVPAPSADDCVTIRVWSNGFHTSLALPGSAFGADHPIRAVFPDETHFLVGYGELEYYQADDPGPAAAVRAAATPTPGVLHVIAGFEPVEERLWRPREIRPVAISRAGLAAIAAGVADSVALEPSPDGSGAPRPVVVGEGRVPRSALGASAFIRSTQEFHLFHMCNHWTAQQLAAAGVPVDPAGAFRADPLMDALAREAAPACPPPEPSAAR